MASSFEPLFPDIAPDAPDTGASGGSWLTKLQSQNGFCADPRYGGTVQQVAEVDSDPALDKALADAFAAGEKQAREAAAADYAAQDKVREKLRLSITKLDTQQQEKLSIRLAETVAALCEETLAPLALDRDALERRCAAAAHLLGDSIIDATLRLHPDDITMMGRDFAATWHMLPDPALERGTISFDTPEGCVVDGPAEWRFALKEALGLC